MRQLWYIYHLQRKIGFKLIKFDLDFDYFEDLSNCQPMIFYIQRNRLDMLCFFVIHQKYLCPIEQINLFNGKI